MFPQLNWIEHLTSDQRVARRFATLSSYKASFDANFVTKCDWPLAKPASRRSSSRGGARRTSFLGEASISRSVQMLRMMLSLAAVYFMSVAVAAIDDVDLAIKVVKETGSDASRLRTYCELTKAMNVAGNNQDAAPNAKKKNYLKKLGPEF